MKEIPRCLYISPQMANAKHHKVSGKNPVDLLLTVKGFADISMANAMKTKAQTKTGVL